MMFQKKTCEEEIPSGLTEMNLMIILNEIKEAKQKGGFRMEEFLKKKEQVVRLLIKKDAYQEEYYEKALVVLGNIFSSNNEIFAIDIFPDPFLKNLREFFMRLCQQQQQDKSQSNQKSMYSCLFIIIQFFYRIRLKNDRQLKRLVKKQLLTKSLIKAFYRISLDYEKNSQKYIKAVGYVLSYLVKNYRKVCFTSLKLFLKRNLKMIHEYKAQFYFLYVLNHIVQMLSKSQIRSFRIIHFVIDCLENHCNSEYSSYLFQVINKCLAKDQYLSVSLLRGKILKYFSVSILNHEPVILQIFIKLIPFIPSQNIQKCFIYHEQYILGNKILPISLKILTLLVKSEQKQHFYLSVLQSKIMKKLLDLKNQPGLQKIIQGFFSALSQKILQLNWNLYILYTRFILKDTSQWPDKEVLLK